MCLAILIGPDEQTGHVGTTSQGSGVFAIGRSSFGVGARVATLRGYQCSSVIDC
jgi:hypothetical protein